MPTAIVTNSEGISRLETEIAAAEAELRPARKTDVEVQLARGCLELAKYVLHSRGTYTAGLSREERAKQVRRLLVDADHYMGHYRGENISERNYAVAVNRRR